LDISITNNEGWGYTGQGGVGGSSLVISFGPHEIELYKKYLGEGVVGLLDVLAEYGEVCHGVVDLDYYIANKAGKYYQMCSLPCLRRRLAAARAWGNEGGSERVGLVRDPREVLLLGPSLVSDIGIGSSESARSWLGSRGFLENEVVWSGSSRGHVALSVSKNVVDFGESVRRSSVTREISRRLHGALCADGYSRESYGIVCEAEEISHNDIEC